MIYTLTVRCVNGAYLRDECVRVIEISEDATLDELHLLIQDAVSFDNDHLYEFFAGRNYRNRRIVYVDAEEWDERAGVEPGVAYPRVIESRGPDPTQYPTW